MSFSQDVISKTCLSKRTRLDMKRERQLTLGLVAYQFTRSPAQFAFLGLRLAESEGPLPALPSKLLSAESEVYSGSQ